MHIVLAMCLVIACLLVLMGSVKDISYVNNCMADNEAAVTKSCSAKRVWKRAVWRVVPFLQRPWLISNIQLWWNRFIIHRWKLRRLHSPNFPNEVQWPSVTLKIRQGHFVRLNQWFRSEDFSFLVYWELMDNQCLLRNQETVLQFHKSKVKKKPALPPRLGTSSSYLIYPSAVISLTLCIKDLQCID